MDIFVEWQKREFTIFINRGPFYLGQFFIEKVTEKAVLFVSGIYSFWCPKSKIKVLDVKDSETKGIENSVTVEIPNWIK